MPWPLLHITGAPSESAAVLVDLNQRMPIALGSMGEFSLGAADVAYGANGTIDGGTREITLPLKLFGTSAQAAGIVSQVARAVSGTSAWLRFQSDAGSPSTWFRLLTVGSGALSWQHVRPSTSDANIWHWDLTLPAEGFGYGALITQPTKRMPVSGVNPWFNLPRVLGDMPTQPIVTLSPSAGFANKTPMLAFTPMPVGPDVEAHALSWAAKVGGVETASSAEFVGGGAVTIDTGVVDFDINAWSGFFPPVPGRYELFIRLKTSTRGQIRGGIKNTSASFGPWVTVIAGARSWINAGPVTLPQFADPRDLPVGSTLDPVVISVESRPAYGDSPVPGWAYVDEFILIPVQLARAAEGTVTRLAFGSVGSTTSAQLVIDGLRRTVYHRDSFFLTLKHQPAPLVFGAFPELVAGNNLMTFLQQTSPSSSGVDDVTAYVDVTIAYHPRYLHLASN